MASRRHAKPKRASSTGRTSSMRGASFPIRRSAKDMLLAKQLTAAPGIVAALAAPAGWAARRAAGEPPVRAHRPARPDGRRKKLGPAAPPAAPPLPPPHTDL